MEEETGEISSKQLVREGQILTGPLFSEPMRVETVRVNGPDTWVVGLVGTQSERFRKVTLTRRDLEGLTILGTRHTYDGDGRLLRLGLQAYSLGIAYEFFLYRDITRFVKRQSAKAAAQGDDPRARAVGFLMSRYRRTLASDGTA
ncbi:hypothetical protein HRbin30_01841 [bacterium HR30]|nr:hypothetical protein HRbin30_01841 [bacterium HR30]